MLISLLTGFVAGVIHVVAGVDHLVAMAPLSLTKPLRAIRAALAWGLGHSTGVLVLGLVAVLIKDVAQLRMMSSWAEFLVGFALLGVGGLAIRTALGLKIHTHPHDHGINSAHKHLHLHIRGGSQHWRHSHAASGLGFLHGLAGASHLLAVVPALALPPLGAASYLLAYLGGSVAAMLLVVIAISLIAIRGGVHLLPLLVGLTGGLSVITGAIWLQRSSTTVFLTRMYS